jgi:VIT1/CCC1 family predicted Fe2+/Mn2+ transporter
VSNTPETPFQSKYLDSTPEPKKQEKSSLTYTSVAFLLGAFVLAIISVFVAAPATAALLLFAVNLAIIGVGIAVLSLRELL